jgi:hypothetical protein
MFSSIDGGFQIVLEGLFTMDFSWFFMFCLIAVLNVIKVPIMIIKKLKK